MSLRRLLALALPSVFLVVVGLVAYSAYTWPSPPPPPHYSLAPYDGTEPFELRIEAMPGLKMFLNPDDHVITPTMLMIGSWETTETAWFLRTVKSGDTIVDAGANV